MTQKNTEMHRTATQTKLLYPKLSYQVRGAIFQIYKTLGSYHKESVYANALTSELEKRKIPFEFLPKNDEKQLSYYLGTIYRLGFLVNFGSRHGVDIRRRIVGYENK